MLELTCLGHATLLVQTDAAAVLCDPIVGPTVSGGGNLIYPAREILIDRLPQLDAILISHHHSDHFCLSDLKRVPGFGEVPVYSPQGSPVLDELRRHGYKKLFPVRVGESFSVGTLSVVPTPSDVQFVEVGFLFRDGEAAALNLVDTAIHGVLDELIALLPERLNLVLAPFQSGGYMFFHPLRVGGPPDGLAEAIRCWAESYADRLADDIMRLRPAHVTPFADGLLYVDAAINAWHFPLPDEAFLNRMALRGVPGTPCRPGLRFRLQRSRLEIDTESEGLIALTPSPQPSRRFDPAVRLNVTDTPDLPQCRGKFGIQPDNKKSGLCVLTQNVGVQLGQPIHGLISRSGLVSDREPARQLILLQHERLDY
ncbi:MAG: MBL fold metallo-hydrolase [candidate division WOR-3 bacterium]